MDDGANLDSGYATDVSMPQQLSGTDWYMESLGLTVSFSLYADLLKTSAWATQAQQNCLTDGVCFGEIQKKGEKEEAEDVFREVACSRDGAARPTIASLGNNREGLPIRSPHGRRSPTSRTMPRRASISRRSSSRVRRSTRRSSRLRLTGAGALFDP